MDILMGFAPWILFWVVAGKDNFFLAVTVSLACAIILNLNRFKRGVYMILDIGTIIFFAAITLAGFFLEPEFIEKWLNVVSNSALLAIGLFSILVGKPFTIQYAKQKVPENLWSTPGFLHVNRVVTWGWTACFACKVVSSLITLTLPQHEAVFDWVIPMVAFVGAIKLTSWYPDHYRNKFQQAQKAGD